VLLAFVAVIVTVPLAFPYRAVLLTVGLGSAATAVATILMSVNVAWYPAMSRLGLDVTNEARFGLVFLLPVSVVWILAGSDGGAGRRERLLAEIEAVGHVIGGLVARIDRRQAERLLAELHQADMRVLGV